MIEMTLEMAEKAVKAAQAKAKDLGTPITVTVVDGAGRLVLCARGDGTGFLTPETSRGQGHGLRRPSAPPDQEEMVDLAREHPAFWEALPDSRRARSCRGTGGVAVQGQAAVVIGAIGCGGGTGEEDHQCALAGVAAVGGS